MGYCCGLSSKDVRPLHQPPSTPSMQISPPKSSLSSAYLEYLRNLTPQIALLTLALVAVAPGKAPVARTPSLEVLLFVCMCVLAAGIAMYCNTTQFLSKAVDPADAFLTERAAKHVQDGLWPIFAHLRAFFQLLKERPRHFPVALVAMVFSASVPWVVLVLAIFGASSALRAIRG
jgi:hypothetical protein